jgi:hypothetical protein
MIASRTEIKSILKITASTDDNLIDQLIPLIEDDIREYCNNNFADKNVYLISGEISFTHNSTSADTINLDISANEDGFVEAQFKAGQTVQVEGSYNNNKFFEIEAVTSTAMTLYTGEDRPYFPELVTEDEDVLIRITKIDYPDALKLNVAQMCKYKLSTYDYSVKSEQVSRYRVEYNQDLDNGYPTSLMTGLKRWRRPVLV